MFKSLPGFREFYPDDCSYRNHLMRMWRSTAIAHGFQEYDAPILEPLELFTEKSGDEIREQLFNFTDKGKREVALRPEMTPSLARLVAAKANSLKRPVKWFSIGEQFRFERPQKGRGRSFYQFNADILGEAGPEADAEIIALAIDSLQKFGIGPDMVKVRLSDRELWIRFLEKIGLNGDAAAKVLGAVDKAERVPAEKYEAMVKSALTGTNLDADDFLKLSSQFRKLDSLEGIKSFADANGLSEALADRIDAWQRLLDSLDAMGLNSFINIDMGIVRGLAYYTGFVFEIFQAGGEGRAIAGGGRYDKLLEKLGGVDMPAVGFAFGDYTFTDLLEANNLKPNIIVKPDAWSVYANDDCRKAAICDAYRLRNAGYHVDYAVKPGVGFSKQMKQASQNGAAFALIYGEDELAADNVTVRDLNNRKEVAVPRMQLLQAFPSIQAEGIE